MEIPRPTKPTKCGYMIDIDVKFNPNGSGKYAWRVEVEKVRGVTGELSCSAPACDIMHPLVTLPGSNEERMRTEISARLQAYRKAHCPFFNPDGSRRSGS